MKKKIYLYLISIIQLLFHVSCSESGKNDRYEIGLEKTVASIPYSLFTDSISYVTLNTNDSCVMSGIFFLNDSTWCRMLDPSESDCNITLQLLHIKKK